MLTRKSQKAVTRQTADSASAKKPVEGQNAMKKHIYVLVPKQPPGQELSLTIKKRKSDSPDEEASASKCVKVEEQLPDQLPSAEGGSNNEEFDDSLVSLCKAVFTHPKKNQPVVKRKRYQANDLRDALKALRSKEIKSICLASKIFNIPRTTLIHKMKTISDADDPDELNVSPGPAPLYGKDSERELKDFLLTLAKRSFLCVRQMLSESIVDIVKEKGKVDADSDIKAPGKSWYTRFLRRNPECKLQLQASKNQPKNTKEILEDARLWFKTLWENSGELELHECLKNPSCVYTLDELAIAVDDKNLIYRRNECRWLYSANTKIIHYGTICFSAAGEMAPPFVVFNNTYAKGKIPTGILATIAPKGWFQPSTLLANIVQLRDHLVSVEKLNPSDNNKKIFLLLDGNANGVTYKIFNYCESVGIVLWCMPARSKILSQPAGLIVESLKNVWSTIIEKNNPSQTLLTDLKFATLFKEAVNTVSKEKLLMKKAFENCGYVPFNSSKGSKKNPVSKNDQTSDCEESDTDEEDCGEEEQEEPEVVEEPEQPQSVDEKALVGGFDVFNSFLSSEDLQRFTSGQGCGKLFEIWRDWGKQVQDFQANKGCDTEGNFS